MVLVEVVVMKLGQGGDGSRGEVWLSLSPSFPSATENIKRPPNNAIHIHELSTQQEDERCNLLRWNTYRVSPWRPPSRVEFIASGQPATARRGDISDERTRGRQSDDPHIHTCLENCKDVKLPLF